MRTLSLVALLCLALGGTALAGTPGGPAPRIPALPDRDALGADARATAARAYEEASRRYGAGDSTGALPFADEAFHAVPNASTAVIQATILADLARPSEAFDALLVAADLDPTPEELTFIREGLAQHGPACVPPLGWARVAVAPDAARWTVDGAPAAGTRTVGLTAGEHLVVVEAAGFAPDTRTVTVRAGEEATLALTLTALPTPVPVVEVPPPVVEPPPVVAHPAAAASPWSPVLPWTLLGGGVAVALTGVGMHVWAMEAADDTSTYGSPVEGMSDDVRRKKFEDADDAMQLRGTLAYVFYGVGGAAAVAGSVLLILDATRPVPSGVAVSPLALPGGAGVSVGGGF